MKVAAVFLFVEICPHWGEISVFAKTVENSGDLFAKCRFVEIFMQIWRFVDIFMLI